MAARGSFVVALLLAVGVLLAGGCTNLRTVIGQPIDPARIPDATSATHYRDTLKALGPPNRISTAGTNLVFLYEHVLIRENQIGISSNIEWLRLLKLSIGKAYARRQANLFIYGPAGRLKSHAFREWTEDLGSGASVQLIFSMINVVDTDAYEVDAYQHLWGARLLEPQLAAGLNRPSSLNSGSQGLEMLATPERAGQHTLEK